MIAFEKKSVTPPNVEESQENRFDQIRRQAAERHRKSDADATRRRDGQTSEKNRLV